MPSKYPGPIERAHRGRDRRLAHRTGRRSRLDRPPRAGDGFKAAASHRSGDDRARFRPRRSRGPRRLGRTGGAREKASRLHRIRYPQRLAFPCASLNRRVRHSALLVASGGSMPTRQVESTHEASQDHPTAAMPKPRRLTPTSTERTARVIRTSTRRAPKPMSSAVSDTTLLGLPTSDGHRHARARSTSDGGSPTKNL